MVRMTSVLHASGSCAYYTASTVFGTLASLFNKYILFRIKTCQTKGNTQRKRWVARFWFCVKAKHNPSNIYFTIFVSGEFLKENKIDIYWFPLCDLPQRVLPPFDLHLFPCGKNSCIIHIQLQHQRMSEAKKSAGMPNKTSVFDFQINNCTKALWKNIWSAIQICGVIILGHTASTMQAPQEQE